MKKLLPLAVVLLAAACSDGPAPFAPTTESSMLVASRSAAAKTTKVDVCHVNGAGTYKLININGNALAAHLAHGDGLPGVEGFSLGCTLSADPFTFVSVGAVLDLNGEGPIVWTVAGAPNAVTFELQHFSESSGGPGGPVGPGWVTIENISGSGPGSYQSLGGYGAGTYQVVATLSDGNKVTSASVIIPPVSEPAP